LLRFIHGLIAGIGGRIAKTYVLMRKVDGLKAVIAGFCRDGCGCFPAAV
jgi:hypothetical protein